MTQTGAVDAAMKIAEDLRSLPFLSDFHVPLPKLVTSGRSSLAKSFGRLRALLDTPQAPMVVAFQVVDAEQGGRWVLEAGPRGCRLSGDAVQAPDVEAILDATRGDWLRAA